MATDIIDTPSHPDRSSAPGRCAAHELNAEQRQQLAVQALARTESVTELAGRHQVSRRFVSQQAAKGAQALAQAFASQAKDEEVLFYLPVTKAWLRQVVLGLVLLCHSSFRQRARYRPPSGQRRRAKSMPPRTSAGYGPAATMNCFRPASRC